MMDINAKLLQWSINFFIRKLQMEQLKMKRISKRVTQTSYKKTSEKESILTFYRQYLGRRSSRYAIDK